MIYALFSTSDLCFSNLSFAARAAVAHFQIITIAQNPEPEELVAVKAALTSGQIRMMKDGIRHVLVVAKAAPEGVLLAGGTDWNGQILASAEVCDHAEHELRRLRCQCILRDSNIRHLCSAIRNILIAGGYGFSGTPQSSAEILDPASGGFIDTGSRTTPVPCIPLPSYIWTVGHTGD